MPEANTHHAQERTNQEANKALLKKYPFIFTLLAAEMGTMWARDYWLANEGETILTASTWIFKISIIVDSLKALLAQHTVFISEAYKDSAQADHHIGHIAQQGNQLAIAISAPVVVMLFFTQNILQNGIGIESGVANHTHQYFAWSALALPLTLCNHMGERLLSAVDQEWLLLPYAAANTIFGLLLNYLLIAQYKAKGAGISLMIQTVIRSALLLIMTRYHPHLRAFKLFNLTKKSINNNRHYMKKILQGGASLFIAELTTSIIQLMTSVYVAKLGTRYLNEEQAVSQWFLLPYILSHPWGESANRLIGQAMGEEKPALARTYGQIGLGQSLLMYLLTTAILIAYSKSLMEFYLMGLNATDTPNETRTDPWSAASGNLNDTTGNRLSDRTNKSDRYYCLLFGIRAINDLFFSIFDASALNLSALQDTLRSSVYHAAAKIFILLLVIASVEKTDLQLPGVYGAFILGMLPASIFTSRRWGYLSQKPKTEPLPEPGIIVFDSDATSQLSATDDSNSLPGSDNAVALVI